MGGENAGAEASAQVAETVERVSRSFFENGAPSKPGDVEEMLTEALYEANTDILKIADTDPEKERMGSTGSLLCLHRGLYFIAQVGDSRIYLERDGEVSQLTRDHTMVWALYESDVITREQLETHPDRNLLTRCIGSPKLMDVDTFVGKVKAGDLFLLCSDGLTGYVAEEEIFHRLHESSDDLKQCAEGLVVSALEGGGGDNVTVVLVRVEEVEAADDWEPEPEEEEESPPEVEARNETEESAQAEVEEKPKGRGALIAIVAAIVIALLIAIPAIMPEAIDVRIRIAALGGDAEISVFDSKGEVVSEAVGDREGEFVALHLPRPGTYRIRVSDPDGEPWEGEVYFSGNETGAYALNPGGSNP